MKIQNNVITIDLNNAGRTKQQKHIIQGLIKDNDLDKLLSYIKTFSSASRQNVSIDRIYTRGNDALNKNIGNVLDKAKRFYDPSADHRPMSKNIKYLGVEIECFIPWDSVDMSVPNGDNEEIECGSCEGSGTLTYSHRDTGHELEGDCPSCDGSGYVINEDESNLDNAINEAHYELKRIFKNNKIKFASIKTDGSIEASEDCFPVEITILTSLDDLSNLEKCCKLINSLGGKVNKSCGMHVHLDARHLNRNEVILIGAKFKKTLPLLLSMVPETRRSNHYCKSQVSFEHRHSAVNLGAYEKHKTIEIRLHSSTTDFNKIKNWITLLNGIANAETLGPCTELNTLTQWVYLSEDLIEYFSQRIALFNIVSSCTSEDAEDKDMVA